MRAITEQLRHLQHDTPFAEYARYLEEALASESLVRLALLLRHRDTLAVSNELMRIFDSYWSRKIQNQIEQDQS